MPAAYLKGPAYGSVQSCIKVPFPNHKAAMYALRNFHNAKGTLGLAAQTAGKLGAYRCDRCGEFHLGHR